MTIATHHRTLRVVKALLSALAALSFATEASTSLSTLQKALCGVSFVVSGGAPSRRFAVLGAAVVMWLCFRDHESLMLHHRYLLGCSLLWLGIAPTDHHARLLMKLQFSAVYVYGVVDKLEVDWLSGGRLMWIMADVWPREFWLLSPQAPALFAVAAWLAVIVEVALAVVPWRRPWAGLLLVVLFHGLIQVLLPVGVFGLVMVVLALVFFERPTQQR